MPIFCLTFLAVFTASAHVLAQGHPHAATGSFAAHMAQQMILMDVIAPLCAWAVGGKIKTPWRFRQTAFIAGTIHAVVMWGWHIPAIYIAMTASTVLHAAMLITFFGAGLFFWIGILNARGNRAGVALFWLFMTVMHTGFLGALLTFGPTTLYDTTIADQRLGGTVMWVMGTGIYALAGLIVAAQWLRLLDRPARRAA